MANYVKFMRGTSMAFDNLQVKESDTLYFISETDALTGKLYIGNKLVNSNMTPGDLKVYLSSLEDVDTTGAKQNNLLGYDTEKQKWVPMEIDIASIQSNIENLRNDVYTKAQIDTIISGIDSLQRKKVNSLEEIDTNAQNADQYIYIVPIGNEEGNKYEEYIVIDKVLEKIGSIGTSSGEVNVINGINEEEFEISKDGKRTLNLKAVPAIKIAGMENNETVKIIQADIATLKTSNESVVNRLNTVETNILELQANSTWGTL